MHSCTRLAFPLRSLPLFRNWNRTFALRSSVRPKHPPPVSFIPIPIPIRLSFIRGDHYVDICVFDNFNGFSHAKAAQSASSSAPLCLLFHSHTHSLVHSFNFHARWLFVCFRLLSTLPCFFRFIYLANNISQIEIIYDTRHRVWVRFRFRIPIRPYPNPAVRWWGALFWSLCKWRAARWFLLFLYCHGIIAGVGWDFDSEIYRVPSVFCVTARSKYLVLS